MSRIGNRVIAIPENVTVSVDGNIVKVSGPKGELSTEINKDITVNVNGNELTLTRKDDSVKNFHGTANANIKNMIVGVTEGYEKVLEVNGVGYRAQKSGKKLTLNLGFSHPVEMEDPEGLESSVDGNRIIIKGIDKEKVGQYAAEIRDKRRPEPYKGKGIKYADEVIRRKVGKTGKK